MILVQTTTTVAQTTTTTGGIELRVFGTNSDLFFAFLSGVLAASLLLAGLGLLVAKVSKRPEARIFTEATVGTATVGVLSVLVLGFVGLLNLTAATEGWGTAAEWTAAIGGIFTGVLAATFAYLAWKASQRATRAEEKAAALAEGQLNQSVNLHLARHDTKPGLTVLRIQLLDDSPTVWIRTAEGGFQPRNDTPETELETLHTALQHLVGWDMTQNTHTDVPWLHADGQYEFSDRGDHRAAGLIVSIGFSVADPNDHPSSKTFHRELAYHLPRIH